MAMRETNWLPKLGRFLSADVCYALGFLALGLFLLPLTYHFPPNPMPGTLGAAFFPQMLIILILIVAVVLIFGSLRRSPGPESGRTSFVVTYVKPMALIAWIFIYLFALPFFGYYASTLVMLLVTFLFFGVQDWRSVGMVIAGFLLFTYVVFDRTLGVLLPNANLPWL